MSRIGSYLLGPGEVEGRRALIGEPAPPFQMQDDEGNNVTLRRLIRRGPVMIHHYRGNW